MRSMTHQPAAQYLKTQVMTASPEMLQLMLWDGAIRFAEQGRQAILKKEIEGSYNALLRAQKIIMEMNTSLKHDVSPELCRNLAGLYTFIYRKLVQANTSKVVKHVEEALSIMRHQRETWVMLMEKLSEARAEQASPTMNENADAIASSREISAADFPVSAASKPALGVRRTGYAGLASKPMPVSASLSVQG
jgi:flagellar protein FliS